MLELVELGGGAVTSRLSAANLVVWPPHTPLTIELKRRILLPLTGATSTRSRTACSSLRCLSTSYYCSNPTNVTRSLTSTASTSSSTSDNASVSPFITKRRSFSTSLRKKTEETIKFMENDHLRTSDNEEYCATRQPQLDGNVLHSIIAASSYVPSSLSPQCPDNAITTMFDDTVLNVPDKDNCGRKEFADLKKSSFSKENITRFERNIIAYGSCVEHNNIRSNSSLSVDYPCTGTNNIVPAIASLSPIIENSPRRKRFLKTEQRSLYDNIFAPAEQFSEYVDKNGVVVVTEKWLLDTIQHYQIQPFGNYSLPSVLELRSQTNYDVTTLHGSYGNVCSVTSGTENTSTGNTRNDTPRRKSVRLAEGNRL